MEISLTSFNPETWKKRYPLLLHTPNPHMRQPMQSNWHKLPIPLKQFNFTNPCIYLFPPKRNPNLGIYLLNLPLPSFPLSTNIIHCHRLKPLKISRILFWSNPPNFILISKSSIIFETASCIKFYFPQLIPSIIDKIITLGGFPMKEFILSVPSRGCLTADSERMFLGILKLHVEDKNLGRGFS